jgi:hypothetical protein
MSWYCFTPLVKCIMFISGSTTVKWVRHLDHKMTVHSYFVAR